MSIKSSFNPTTLTRLRAPPQPLSLACFASLHVGLQFALVFVYASCSSFYVRLKPEASVSFTLEKRHPVKHQSALFTFN